MRVALNMLFVGGGVAGGRVYCEGLLRGLAGVAPVSDHYVAFARQGVSLPPLPDRFEVFRAPVSGDSVLGRTAWEYLRLPGAVRGGRFDLFHALGSLSPSPPRGVPFVLTVHDQIYRHFPASMPVGHRLFSRFVQPRSARRAARVIVPSASARDDVIRFLGVKSDRIRIVPYGAGNAFRVIDNAAVIDDAIARFGLKKPYVLSVARGYPHKNLAGLLRAVARLKAGAADASLVLVGDRYMVGPELDRLISELKLNDRVRFTGFASNDDLNALYCGAVVFAFPSLAEGLGLPVLEAMACGVPVVASNASAVPEAVGDAGVVADARDPAAFAAALESVLGDDALRADLARRGLARAAEFTWEKCAAETLAVYRELA
jgi:glycosyltransferase involved in cell wall biosynthesis